MEYHTLKQDFLGLKKSEEIVVNLMFSSKMIEVCHEQYVIAKYDLTAKRKRKDI